MFFIALYYLYHLTFFMMSLALEKVKIDAPSSLDKKTKLAVYIPAHNEENVIVDSVRSILSADYPKNLYDKKWLYVAQSVKAWG